MVLTSTSSSSSYGSSGREGSTGSGGGGTGGGGADADDFGARGSADRDGCRGSGADGFGARGSVDLDGGGGGVDAEDFGARGNMECDDDDDDEEEDPWLTLLPAVAAVAMVWLSSGASSTDAKPGVWSGESYICLNSTPLTIGQLCSHHAKTRLPSGVYTSGTTSCLCQNTL